MQNEIVLPVQKKKIVLSGEIRQKFFLKDQNYHSMIALGIKTKILLFGTNVPSKSTAKYEPCKGRFTL